MRQTTNCHQFLIEDSKEIFSNESSVGLHLASTPSNDYVKLTIASNGEIGNHTLPLDIHFFIIEGEGLLLVDKIEYIMKKDDMITVPADTLRSWQNSTKKPLIIWGIKIASNK